MEACISFFGVLLTLGLVILSLQLEDLRNKMDRLLDYLNIDIVKVQGQGYVIRKEKRS